MGGYEVGVRIKHRVRVSVGLVNIVPTSACFNDRNVISKGLYKLKLF